MQSDELKRRISAGRGDALADLVLKNARIVNVFTEEIDTADIAISGNSIVGVGTYHGRKEVDLHGKYVCPGLIDGHIHIESSMLCGPAFEQAVLPHGTTAVVTDPHEISNVAGLEEIRAHSHSECQERDPAEDPRLHRSGKDRGWPCTALER